MASHTLSIGNVEIMSVVDAAVPRAPRHALFPQIAEEQWTTVLDRLLM